MTNSGDHSEGGSRHPPKPARGKRLSGQGRPKLSLSRLTVIQRLLHKPVEIMKNEQPMKMSALEAILHQLLQKALSGDSKADRALQKFEDFAHQNSMPELEIVFVDTGYTRAFAAAAEDNDE